MSPVTAFVVDPPQDCGRGLYSRQGTSGRHPLKIYSSEETKGIVDVVQDSIPYILTAALIVVGALLAYLILTTGPPSQQSQTSTTSAVGTSVYSAGFPASLAPTFSPPGEPPHSPAVAAFPDRLHGCQINAVRLHTTHMTPLGAADCFE